MSNEISIQDFKRLTAQTRRDWLQQFVDEEQIKKTTFDRLDKQFDKLLCKFLSLNTTSRSSNRTSPVVQFISRTAESAVGQWVDENKDMLPELSQEAKDDLREHYLSEYHRQLKENLEQIAARRAKSDAEEIIETTTDIFGD